MRRSCSSQITALTNAKDPERLALLKEVAGTKVYEQRRSESLRIMAETDAKRGKIDELLEYIDTRLTELEEEKEELKEFQDKDKERRCLEYALYSRELEEVTETLEEIEEERRGEVHSSNMRREQYNDREKQAQVSGWSESRTILLTASLSRSSKPFRRPGMSSQLSTLRVKALKPRSQTLSARAPNSNALSPTSVSPRNVPVVKRRNLKLNSPASNSASLRAKHL